MRAWYKIKMLSPWRLGATSGACKQSSMAEGGDSQVCRIKKQPQNLGCHAYHGPQKGHAKNRQKAPRQTSTLFDNLRGGHKKAKNRQKRQKQFLTLFDNFHAAPKFLPRLWGTECAPSTPEFFYNADLNVFLADIHFTADFGHPPPAPKFCKICPFCRFS